MNLERAFPGQQSFWEGKDFDILKYARLPISHQKAVWEKLMCYLPAFGDPFKAQTTTGP